MQVLIGQLNPVVGDIRGNKERLMTLWQQCEEQGADLLVLPELYLTGYPPRDLLSREWFITVVEEAIDDLLAASRSYETAVLLGAPQSYNHEKGRGLYNSALLIYRGQILFTQHKSLLPIYDVFDEARYFAPATEVKTVEFKGQVLGISICEDAWNSRELWPRGLCYDFDPIGALARQGATVIINISASPYHLEKEKIRYEIIRGHARKHGIPFLYVNQVGANDELVFDGRSMLFDGQGQLVTMLPGFREQVQKVSLMTPGSPDLVLPDRLESVYEALCLGIRDYVSKCGFSSVILGLSGGIDSALVSALAAAALGADKVYGITMPSPYSSRGSVEDSRNLARNLGLHFMVHSIEDIYYSYLNSLKGDFREEELDISLENIQARIRGNILMAYSNKYGHLVLTTGNKSEMAVGYSTLYGDMSGGLSVLSDVPKTMVYQLAEFINRQEEIIPRAILQKPPSAELKPDQKDQDTLPPYPVLDQILYYYVELDMAPEDIIHRGFDPDMVWWIIRAVDRSEYKRRQAPPGLKITGKAFGMGRRMPIAARYNY